MRLSGPVLISILVIAGFISACVLLLLKPITLSDNAGQILNILLGTLGAKFSDVVSYHIGSSAGSKAKDATMQALTAGQGKPPA